MPKSNARSSVARSAPERSRGGAALGPIRRQLKIAGRAVALTPLILPAFSTEADLDDGLPSVLDGTLRALLGPALVSAFDIASGAVPDLALRLATTKMPFAMLDSGGYELLRLSRSGRERPPWWSREAHEAVLAGWPAGFPAIAVSYDDPSERHGPVDRQVGRASDLFARHARFGRCLLLKPPEGGNLTITDIAPHVAALAPFDVIGLTEKEAGSSHVERLHLIRALRTALDRAGVEVPLHVFGSLDPFLAPSYLLAGADIFDGLSWIRHGFSDGLLLDPQNHNAAVRPDLPFDEGKRAMRRANLRVVSDLQVAMQRVAEGASLEELGGLTGRILEIHRTAFLDDLD